MTPKVEAHIKAIKVSEGDLLRGYFTSSELEAISNGPSISTSKLIVENKVKKRRKKP